MTKRSKIIIIVVLLAMIAALMFTLLFNMGWIRSRKGALPREDAKLRYPYSQLSATEKALYGALYRGVEAREDTISLPGTYDKNTYTRVYLLLAEQEPQFFYLDSVYETADLMDKANMRYKVPKDEIDMMRAAMNVRADEIISRIPSDADDIQKLLAIHDGIAAGCDYTDGDYQDEAYGCLEAGEAKCEGYAKAFLFTARRAGLNVMNVTGTINGTENHVWNIAEVNGQYYNVDVTWDDSAQYNGHTTHTCFAVPDAIFGDHQPDLTAYQPPVCEDDSLNYYTMNALIVRQASELPTMASTWLWDPMLLEFRMADDAVVKSVSDMLATSREMRDAVQLTSGAVSYRAFMDETRRALVILPS
jgi:hypothetical protein